jgi:TPR repeat protein
MRALTHLPIILASVAALITPAGATAASKVEVLTSVANSGDAVAEHDLGQLYRSGEGVAQDKTKAFCWIHRSAEHGNIMAWMSTGMMYGIGEGVPLDRIEAYKWFELADRLTPAEWPADIRKFAVEDRAAMAKRMTAADVAEARRRATEWWEQVQARGKPAANRQYVEAPGGPPAC